MNRVTLIGAGLLYASLAFSLGRAAETEQMLEVDAARAVADYQSTLDTGALARVIPELNAAFSYAASSEEQGRTQSSKFEPLLSVSSKLISALYGTADMNFDAAKKPQTNPGSPGGTYSSGTDPAGIKDPNLRATYEQKIAQQRKYAEYYQQQSRVFRTIDELALVIGENLSGTADEDVRSSLATSGMDSSHVEHFLRRMAQSRSAKAK